AYGSHTPGAVAGGPVRRAARPSGTPAAEPLAVPHGGQGLLLPADAPQGLAEPAAAGAAASGPWAPPTLHRPRARLHAPTERLHRLPDARPAARLLRRLAPARPWLQQRHLAERQSGDGHGAGTAGRPGALRRHRLPARPAAAGEHTAAERPIAAGCPTATRQPALVGRPAALRRLVLLRRLAPLG